MILPNSKTVSLTVNTSLIFDDFSNNILANVSFNIYVVQGTKLLGNNTMFQNQINTNVGKWSNSTEITFYYPGGQVSLKFNLTFLESVDQGSTFQPAQFLDLSISSFEFSTTQKPSEGTPEISTGKIETRTEPNFSISLETLLGVILVFVFIAIISTSDARRRRKIRKQKMVKANTIPKPINQPIFSKHSKYNPKICISCGALLKPEDSFCYSCGVKIETFSDPVK